MLSRSEQAHDWDATYSLFEDNAEAPVVPFLTVAGVAYSSERIRAARKLVEAFSSLLGRAQTTLFDYSAHEGYRAASATSKEKVESVTRVPPQKAADLRIAIRNYDSVFRQTLPEVPKPRPKSTVSRRRAAPWR